MIRVTRFRLVSLYVITAMYAGIAAWSSSTPLARNIHMFMVVWWAFLAGVACTEKAEDD